MTDADEVIVTSTTERGAMSDQEQWIASTFVEIADHLVDEFDVIELLATLAERCAEYVHASEVGFLLVDPSGTLQVIGSTSEQMEILELLELQSSEGPCWDCYKTGESIVNQAIDDANDRWPTFTPAATAIGLRTVHALPMRLRSNTIGAINIFHVEQKVLSPGEVSVTQAFADVATIAIMQVRTLRNATQLAEQLQHALEARIIIEQAKGVLSSALQLNMADAFNALRKYSREHSYRLSTVALDVTEGKLAPVLFGSFLDRPTKQQG